MPEFLEYFNREWLSGGVDDRGMYLRFDADWAVKAMKKDGWKVRLTGEKQMEPGDGFRFYFTLIGAS